MAFLILSRVIDLVYKVSAKDHFELVSSVCVCSVTTVVEDCVWSARVTISELLGVNKLKQVDVSIRVRDDNSGIRDDFPNKDDFLVSEKISNGRRRNRLLLPAKPRSRERKFKEEFYFFEFICKSRILF